MSDGPYRSLQMSRPWKRAARFAENPSSSEDEIRNAIFEALLQESKNCLLPGLAKKATESMSNQSLFGEFGLEKLRQLVLGQNLANAFLENLISLKAPNRTVFEGIINALTLALADRSQRAIRQIEEHYLRKTTRRKTNLTLSRLVASLRREGFENLSSRILANDTRTSRSQQTGSGLDEGVAL